MITTRKLERQRRKYKIAPPRKGDVFTIPLDDGRVYLGQVIAFERFDLLFYIVVFDLVTTPEQASGLVDRALASRPILAGQTMDALFRPGGWKVVGNRPSEAARFLPAYKMDTPQGVFVKDFLATRQRPATPEEAEHLPPEHSTSPMIFQMALNSFHGLADHLDYFDTMDPDNIITAREIFGRGLVKSIVEWWEGVRRGAVKRGR